MCRFMGSFFAAFRKPQAHESLVQARVQPNCPSGRAPWGSPVVAGPRGLAEPVPGVFLLEEIWKSLWGENENHL